MDSNLNTNKENEEAQIFDSDFFIALADWQKGWKEDQSRRTELARKLVIACDRLPAKFKVCNQVCYRKRFIVKGELVQIILREEYFEGIASWSLDLEFAKGFKGRIKDETIFCMIFKTLPEPSEVVLNICELWKSSEFRNALTKFQVEMPDEAKPLLHFKDSQQEVILHSTLRGREIEHIVGTSSGYDELFDKSGIEERYREHLSKELARQGAEFLQLTFASKNAVVTGIQKALADLKVKLEKAAAGGK